MFLGFLLGMADSAAGFRTACLDCIDALCESRPECCTSNAEFEECSRRTGHHCESACGSGKVEEVVEYIANAQTRYVETDDSCGGNTPCYASLQGALDAAGPGDPILMASGFYAGPVTLDRADAADMPLIASLDAQFTLEAKTSLVVAKANVPNRSVVPSIKIRAGTLLLSPTEQYYKCHPNGPSRFEDCIDDAYNSGCLHPGCTVWLQPTDLSNYFTLDTHYPLPENMKITGDTGNTDCDQDPDGCKLNTFIVASQAVDNGCGSLAPQGPRGVGNPATRIGFILNNNSWIGNFIFKSMDTGRWQGYGGAALCGGGVFETPGCSDAYCASPEGEDIYSRGGSVSGSNDGITAASVHSVFITGNDAPVPAKDCQSHTAPQLAVFLNRTRDLAMPSNNIDIFNLTMLKSWADGINVHGSTHNVTVEHSNLACQGDDNLAVWSTQAPHLAKNIHFYDNTLSQEESTNPNKEWGVCVALYGGGGSGPDSISIKENHCARRSADPNAQVKFSNRFQDPNVASGPMFTQDSHIYVLNKANNPASCQGSRYNSNQPEAFPWQPTINGCPDISGWPSCPDAAFIHLNCDQQIKAEWRDEGSWGPGWYCADDNVPTDWSDIATSCIHQGCGSEKPGWDSSLAMWTCSDGITFDSCRIHSGCTPSDGENVMYDSGSDSWTCKGSQPSDPVYDACIVQNDCPKVGQRGLRYVNNWKYWGVRDFTGWVCTNAQPDP